VPNLLTPLPFLDASEQPANGFIFAQATRTFSTVNGFITTVRSMGRIVDGVFLTSDDSKSDPFVLSAATVDAPLNVTVKLDSYDASGRLVKGSGGVTGRTVTVPDVGTVTWADLVDVAPVTAGGLYAVEPWMQDLMDAATAADASATAAATSATDSDTARAAAVVAKDAAEAVPVTTDGLITSIDGNAASAYRVQADARLSATFAPLSDSVFIPAREFSPTVGSPAQVAVSSSFSALAFDAAASEYVMTLADLPPEWATLTLTLHWANLGAGAGNVLWVWDYIHLGDGDSIAGTPFTAGSGVARTAPAQNVLRVTLTEFSTPQPAIPAPSGSRLLGLRIRRMGADALDTLPNDAGLFGVTLTKVS